MRNRKAAKKAIELHKGDRTEHSELLEEPTEFTHDRNFIQVRVKHNNGITGWVYYEKEQIVEVMN